MKQICGCVGCKIVGLLVILGALNWGLIGIFQVDLVAKFLGNVPHAGRIVYSLIGIAGVMKLISCFVPCPMCKNKTA